MWSDELACASRATCAFVRTGLAWCAVLAGCDENIKQRAACRSQGSGRTPVVVAKVEKQQVPLEVTGDSGMSEAFSAVEVKSQVAGPIARVAFQEGQDVRARAESCSRSTLAPFTQAVREAEAEVANRKAALAQVEANYERDQAQARNARSQANRYASLTAKGIVAREQNENSRQLRWRQRKR